MAKKKRDRKPAPVPPADDRQRQGKAVSPAPTPTPGARAQAITRELVEMIVTAFVLAFLFRTFEAEAFVIPTGSMATTLMGRHKDVECPMCHYPYQVSASEEVNSETGAPARDEDGYPIKVTDGTCPMCHYEMRLAQEDSYNGDRILVNKFAYQFSDPERFDVAVFHCPDEARTNYVKRITGLPGETIRIRNGDLFVRKDGQSGFEIARKPPGKFLAMLRTVYDNDRVLPEKLLARGWPARWQAADSTGGWRVSEDHRSFAADGKQPGEAWLRYHHYLPNPGIWKRLERGEPLTADVLPKPRLVADDCQYNSTVTIAVHRKKEEFKADQKAQWEQQRRMGFRAPAASDSVFPRDWEDNGLGLHWVGDLAVACTLAVRGESGSVLFELVEGVRTMRCRLDAATGQATLSISGPEGLAWTGQTRIRGPGEYEILFANVDDELRLSVDGRWITFDRPTAHPPLGNDSPTDADLSPVGIASVGADVEVHHLRILRDTYYIADKDNHGPVSDFEDPTLLYRDDLPATIAGVMSSPKTYARAKRRHVDFTLEKDQFLALGDNSARSKDSRLWAGVHYVDRELLIGQALCIYWPHSWDEIRLGDWKIPFPFFPNFAKMGFVR
ncbi:MAG: signal peptidase I [Pirellulales bacterium]|nr:signal peptidase I [Pirellulales bacterium]